MPRGRAAVIVLPPAITADDHRAEHARAAVGEPPVIGLSRIESHDGKPKRHLSDAQASPGANLSRWRRRNRRHTFVTMS
jgi:hypothetical protein